MVLYASLFSADDPAAQAVFFFLKI